jgi:3-oxoacyl-[acyl-carrier-protein] synthase II
MAEGCIAPTLNLEKVDERCAMINHVMQFREQKMCIASIQNFAFGGVNTNIIIKKL